MSTTSDTVWVTVAPAGDVPPGERRVYDLDGHDVAVYHLPDGLHAIEDVCTHDGNSLSDGPVEGTEVVCPRHGARFCLLTGAALCPPAYEAIQVYRVEERDGALRLGLP